MHSQQNIKHGYNFKFCVTVYINYWIQQTGKSNIFIFRYATAFALHVHFWNIKTTAH